MKLLYATSVDLPSTRANRVQIVSMAQAFAEQLGDSFLLGLHKNAGEPLGVRCIEMPQRRSAVLAWRYMRVVKEQRITRIYCREERLLFFMMLYNRLWYRLPLTFFYELHHFDHAGFWYHALLARVDGVVAITHGVKGALAAAGYSGRVLVAPDAVRLEQFSIALSQDDARRSLAIAGGFLALYAGTLDEPWKGAGVLYEAAKLGAGRFSVMFVGGKAHHIEHFLSHRESLPNAVFVGHKPHGEIPMYLKAADVLVLPNSAKEEISRTSTSPMKLFEYMASGRPIVASNLPSIREVLNESSAVLVEPDNAGALAEGVQRLIDDPALGAPLAAQARADVGRYTWDTRARAVLNFIA